MPTIYRSQVLLTGLFAVGIIVPFSGEAAYQPPARLTFTFDETSKTMVDRAAPLFQVHNLPAVIYAETALVGSGDWAMTWDDLKRLRDNLKWEIGSHSITHPDLTKVTAAQLEQELAGSRKAFADHGIMTNAFATPLGAYDNRVLKSVSRHYTSHRAAWNGPNAWPETMNDYELLVLEVKHNIPPETVMGWIDEAVAQKQWLVLLLHDVVVGVPAEYQYNTNDLKKIVDYAATRPIAVTTIEGGKELAKGANLVKNPSFELMTGKFAQNWSRTNSQAVLIDAKKNGNAPMPYRSLQFVGRGAQQAAASALIPVAQTPYLLRIFHDSSRLTAGGWVVWVNEYDAGGQWTGGQWLGGVYGPSIGTRSLSYEPTSSSVKNIQLYFYMEAAFRGIAYLDSVELRAINDLPSPPPPPPPSENLLSNGSFENLTNGFATGWTRTSVGAVVIDGNSNGHEPLPLRSLKLTGNATQNAAVSPRVTITDFSANYEVSLYQRMDSFQKGGLAVWINEYDATQNWISGQWLGGRYEPLEGVMALPYKPTSSAVRTMELEIYTEAQSAFTAFVDEVAVRKK